MKGITSILCWLLLIISTIGIAQQSDSILKYKSNGNSFRYTYENDLFNETDRYYTQGSKVEVRHKIFSKSPFSIILIPAYSSAIRNYGIAFKQDVFTPKTIRNKILDTTDRPYAGVFYFSQTLEAISTLYSTKFNSSFDIGFIGPVAIGEEQQKFIHKHTRNEEPLGWENQISNSFIANYHLWMEKSILGTRPFDMIAQLGGKAGILNTNASAGMLLRIGKKRSYFGKVRSEGDKFELFVDVNGTATYVVYNAVLQGIPWRKSIHVLDADKIERWVYGLKAGLTISIKRLSLNYHYMFITPEFKGGLHHGWGSCNIVVWF